jgi:hypothetical protein
MPLARFKPELDDSFEVTRYKNLDTAEITVEVPSLGLTLDQQSFDTLFVIEDRTKQPAKRALSNSGAGGNAAPDPKAPGPAPTQATMLNILRQFGPLTRSEWVGHCKKANVSGTSANSTIYLMRNKNLVEQFDDEAAGGLTKWRVK